MTGPAPGVAVPAPRSIRRYVLEDERIVLATRHHWARVVEPVATTLAAFVVVGFLVGLLRADVGDGVEILWWVWLAVLARALVRLIGWRVEWFVATDKRMLLLTGLITHRVAMMPLHKVTDMSYARSVVGRLLGYGEFVLESAGQDQAMRRISFMPRPDDSYRTLCATIFGSGAGPFPGQGPMPPRAPSAATRPDAQVVADPGVPTVPTLWSLVVIVAILGVVTATSLAATRGKAGDVEASAHVAEPGAHRH